MTTTRLNVFTAIKRGDNQPDFMLKIGAAWPHKSGKGFSVRLNALPIDGKLILLEPREGEAEDDTAQN